MIPCVTDNIYYSKKKSGKKRKRRFGLFIFFLIVAAITLYYRFIVSENVVRVCADKCYAVSVKSVNAAIISSLDEKVYYENFVTVDKNTEGKITLISANSFNMNSVSRRIVETAQIVLGENLKKGIDVPLFAFSGFSLLSGYGPDTNFKAVTVDSVTCEFISTFTSTGINQTLHSIYAEIVSEIKIDFPLNEKKEIYKTRVLLCEAVLVGEVPEIYLNGGLFNKS